MRISRDPGIHLKESDLLKYLSRYYPTIDSQKFVAGLKVYGTPHRLVVVSDDFIEKKVENMASSKRLDASIFAKVLYLYRKKLRHVGVQPIKPTSRDWVMVKKITKIAIEFCDIYKLPLERGFSEFIRIGLIKMQKFSLIKFLSLGEAIGTYYQAELEIKQDKKPTITQQGYEYYTQIIIDKTGIDPNYKHFPEKYVFFYKARLLAEQHKVSITDYIKAQFQGFEWRSDYPDPAQLIGDKAIQRLAKAQFQITRTPKKRNINLRAILKK